MPNYFPLLILECILKDVKNPSVTRTVQVPGNYSFFQLHIVINIAFGWQNSHLHEFSSPKDKNLIIGSVFEENDFEERDILDESEIILTQYLQKPQTKMIYLYDMGDYWEHEIILKEVLQVPKSKLKVKLLGGSGACPPEDSGGVPGYEWLKEIMRNPKHEEYKTYRKWLGLTPSEIFDPWDAKVFNTHILLNKLNDTR